MSFRSSNWHGDYRPKGAAARPIRAGRGAPVNSTVMRILRTLAGLALALFVAACGSTSPSDGTLGIEDLTVGTGATVVTGDTVTVTYVGTLTNGNKFDSSRDRNEGFTFALGRGQVIKGWDEGVAGMKIGEVRKLTIPPEMGYGAGGYPPVIPPNSTLVFEVELLSVR